MVTIWLLGLNSDQLEAKYWSSQSMIKSVAIKSYLTINGKIEQKRQNGLRNLLEFFIPVNPVPFTLATLVNQEQAGAFWSNLNAQWLHSLEHKKILIIDLLIGKLMLSMHLIRQVTKVKNCLSDFFTNYLLLVLALMSFNCNKSKFL